VRTLIRLVLVIAALAALPASALAHAVVLSSTPAEGSAGNAPPSEVRVQFSEPVTLLAPTDMEVVGEDGESVVAGSPRVAPDDARTIVAPVRSGLSEQTYTVRFRIVSADSHIIAGVRAFAVGPGPVQPPNLGGTGGGGPSITGGWAVSARFLELVGLGGLLGLLTFRWLVWAPVWRSRWAAAAPAEERERVLSWGRDMFWMAFGALAVGAMVAEAYLLVTYSASALGTTVLEALRNSAGIGDVLSTTRLGGLLQRRGALLFGVFAIGVWQFLAEFGGRGEPRPAGPMGARMPSALMIGLVLVVLYGISAQGHASQAPWAPVQIGADIIHLAAAAVWIGGLALLAVCLLRVPRLAPASGPRLGTALLARFSAVALIALAVVVLTGTVRSVGQLSDPAQLWETAYGRSILIKVGLMALVGAIAMRNRRIVNTLVLMARPSRAGVVAVRRAVTLELALALGIVLVASLLVAQVPGRV